MAIAITGLRRIFLFFIRPRAEFIQIILSFLLNKIGVTCGEPSGMIVPRKLKAFFVSVNKSL
jgi:hypothetical protein